MSPTRLILPLLLLATLPARADTVKFDDETCSYRAEFDGKRYSARQFHDTMDFMIRFNPLAGVTERDGVAKVERAYADNQAKLNRYQLLPMPIFAHAKAQAQAQLDFFRTHTLSNARAIAAGAPELLGQGLPEAITRQCRAEKMRVRREDLPRGQSFHDWHNCINQFQPSVDLNGEGPNGMEAARKAFFGALKHVKKGYCDEP